MHDRASRTDNRDIIQNAESGDSFWLWLWQKQVTSSWPRPPTSLSMPWDSQGTIVLDDRCPAPRFPASRTSLIHFCLTHLKFVFEFLAIISPESAHVIIQLYFLPAPAPCSACGSTQPAGRSSGLVQWLSSFRQPPPRALPVGTTPS